MPNTATPSVAVLMGGPSREHDVSVNSGKAIAKALRAADCTVDEILFSEPRLPPVPSTATVVFPALHGRFGEDGALQALMDAAGVRYVGCTAAASALIIDKEATKRALRSAGVPCPDGRLITDRDAPCPDGLPLIVKPNREGSTIGLSVVREPGQWSAALAAAFACDDAVLVEDIVSGREITVGLLDGAALPVVEIVPPGGLFDYDAKYVYSKGHTVYHCPPATVATAALERARELAERSYVALGARDVLRVDMMVDDSDGAPIVLEANSMPGFTATSLLPKAAAAAGISFPQLCLRLVRAAAMRG